MPYDEELAARVRVAVNSRDDVGVVEERRMFGGLAFLVHGHMALAVSGSGGVMVRVSPDDLADLVTQDHVERMVMRGPVKGWVRVLPAGLADDAGLESWVDRGVAAVAALG